jgi:hypothetical protein
MGRDGEVALVADCKLAVLASGHSAAQPPVAIDATTTTGGLTLSMYLAQSISD